ncbi:hypothetical protein SAMN05661091_5153 [Paenibacillus uliginis N3/975]|uniref:Uncharacterized protein n=1 Tax=Paenibacillus uliginis N3/975 TaxID=1313296 RepID=A0A1X7HRN0_9BACL|nr:MULTISPECIES: hypothetical protein [Paenibacillus]UNK19264.1 hypothetical protein MNQ98_04290 [Paenibacillus sp. N3/727]SMF90634.1 hypothetical protein SAMN05661091_5153 [Paenibacillus uliginis N3/975]
MNDKRDQDLERQLSELLTDGEMESKNKEEEGRRLIPPKYEVRVQTTLDPIVEETRKYRSIAKEMDDRYDKYMERAGGNNDGSSDSGSST